MAIDSDYLRTLAPEQGYDYLRDYYTQHPEEVKGGSYYEGHGPTDVDPWVQSLGTEMLVPSGRDQSYVVRYGTDGKIDVSQQLADSWYDRDSGLGFGLPIGALLPFAAAAGAAALGPAAAGEGALSGAAGSEVLAGGTAADVGGSSLYSLAQPGATVNLGGSTMTLGGAGIGEGALGTGLLPGISASGIGGGALGTGLVAGGGGAAALGTPGLWETLTSGLGNALSNGAQRVAGNAGNSLVSSALNAGRNLLTGGGSGSSGGGSSGLGGLGGLGGILGLALLMAQLRKDKNATPAGATPVIPLMRSKVKQNPFTLDEQGNKKAPLAYFGEPVYYAAGGGIGGLAAGGETSRAIRGPGDGVSDSIPAEINGNEPAALADGEFVIDARTVAELGNGSTEAGTRKLEAMVNRVHEARAKAKRGEDSNADRHMPV